MPDSKSTRLPTTRIGRFSRFTRLAGRVAGGMAAEGIRQLASGNRPKMQHMVLTPGNVRRLTSELQKMRGAAMKLGQILSMDAGEFIPEELAEILAHLRADAHYMPDKQLEQQLAANYGVNWRDRFAEFDRKPVAAASIGQVHKVVTHQGDVLALKIQYPGIKDSIDSDVNNLVGLLRMTNLIPKSLDLTETLDEVRYQLHDEANYMMEADFLTSFGELLADDARFKIPKLYRDFSTEAILAMEFVESVPIESVKDQPQDVRNRIMETLFELMFKELFELNLMQTDANFANYRYDPEGGKIVLLDFGATRRFAPDFAARYSALIKAIYADDEAEILKAAGDVGYNTESNNIEYQNLVVEIFRVVGEIFTAGEDFDFTSSDFWNRANAINDAMMEFRDDWRAPPIDALYFHRKVGGLFMLAGRLQARVAVHSILEQYLPR